MSYSDKKDTELMEQQTAVMSYLEDLLKDVPEASVEEVPDNVVTVFPKQVETAEVAAPVVEEIKTTVVETPVVEKTETTVLEAPVESVEAPAVSVASPAQVEVEQQQTEQTTEAVAEPTADTQSYPEWVEDEFQCLMFKVVGISMAVPLNRLNGVIPWENNLTPMPGHSEAFLGLLRHLDKNVKVMDAAKVILPAEQLKQLDTEDERINKILLMDEGRWGLACDDVGEVITLNKDEVRWRTASGRRPWLAGTISERLCALLDTEVLAGILSTGK